MRTPSTASITPDRTVQKKLILSFSLFFVFLFAVADLVGILWYRNILNDSLDAFLTSEARSIQSALMTYFDAKAPQAVGAKDFVSFVREYVQKRANFPQPYKTTLYVFDELNAVIASSNHAIDLDVTSPLYQLPAAIDRKVVDQQTRIETIPVPKHPYRVITTHLMHEGIGLGWFRLACLTETVYGGLGTFMAVLTLILTVLCLLSLLAIRWLVALAFHPSRRGGFST